MGFYLEEANCLRCLDHMLIDETIARRRHWREIAKQRWITGRQKLGTIIGRNHREITEETVDNLHAVADMLLTAPQGFKLVVSVNHGHVYTNDLLLIDRLDRMPILTYKTFTQAKIVRPKDTVALKKPKHKFRSYFRLCNLTAQQKDHLEAFLTNHLDHVRVSPALQEWLAIPYTRIQDYFFVDHDNESWLTMLNLVVPGCLRKTMHIIPAK